MGGSASRISVKDFFGVNAVHHPNPIGFAVLSFDLLEESSQSGSVGGVACQNFVGDGKTSGVTTR
jgi:hypothetical protein